MNEDLEYIITDRMACYSEMQGFPQPEAFDLDKETIEDYITAKQSILTDGEERRKKLLIPAVLLIMPTIVMSAFSSSMKAFFAALAAGLILACLYWYGMQWRDAYRLRRLYQPDIERFIAAVLAYEP